MEISLNIKIKRLTTVLIIITLFFFLSSLIGDLIRYYTGSYYVFIFLNYKNEISIARWYGSLLLLFCTFLLIFITSFRRRMDSRIPFHWYILSLIFFGLTIIKIALIHKYIFSIMSDLLKQFDLYIILIIFFVIFAVIVFFLSLIFYINIRNKVKKYFFYAFFMYIIVAIPLDIFSDYLSKVYGINSIIKNIVSNIEECCETLGSCILIFALFEYIANISNNIKISFLFRK